MMLREALGFPTSGRHGSRALLAGSLLLLVVSAAASAVTYAVDGGYAGLAVGSGVVLLGSLLAVRGYYYRTVRAAATRSSPVAPSFGGVGRLLREGVVASVVAVVYLLPAGLLLGAAAGGAALSRRANGTPQLLAESLGAAAALFGIAALFAALYLTPAAIAALGRGDGVGSAFRVRSVVQGAATEDYVVGWVVATALQWTLGTLGLLFSALLVGAVLYFLVAVAARYLWGRSFASALDTERTVPREGITPPNRDDAGAGLHRLLMDAAVSEEGDRTDRGDGDAE